MDTSLLCDLGGAALIGVLPILSLDPLELNWQQRSAFPPICAER